MHSAIGTTQGTKLGPVLWLIHCNYPCVDGFVIVKYADDSKFYVTVEDHATQSAILPALNATHSWFNSNNNAAKSLKNCDYEHVFLVNFAIRMMLCLMTMQFCNVFRSPDR